MSVRDPRTLSKSSEASRVGWGPRKTTLFRGGAARAAPKTPDAEGPRIMLGPSASAQPVDDLFHGRIGLHHVSVVLRLVLVDDLLERIGDGGGFLLREVVDRLDSGKAYGRILHLRQLRHDLHARSGAAEDRQHVGRL